jgi:RND family efflux transporter MFP subunit
MNKKAVWTVAVLVVAVGALVTYRAYKKRTAPPPEPVVAAQAAPRIDFELGAGDVFALETLPLTQTIDFTGSVKATRTAWVKARVAGELQNLLVREGEAVQLGQVLGRIDATEYQARERQLRMQAEAAKAQVDIAQRQFDNNKALVEQGFISRNALETSVSNLASAQANHLAAQAALDSALYTLDQAQLRAPLSGLVAQRAAQNGERLSIDSRIVELVDPTQLEIEAFLTPEQIGDVKIGQSASISTDAGTSLVARVLRISPVAQAGNRTVAVYLQPLKASPALRHGAFVQGQLELGRTQVLAVPENVVRTDKPEPYVQVVHNGEVAHVRIKVLGKGQHKGETYTEIEGVVEGSLILQASLGLVREGSTVALQSDKASAAPQASPQKAP